MVDSTPEADSLFPKPSSGKDRLYVVSRRGETFVLAAKPELNVIARNPLNETTRASVVPSGGELFVRTDKHLWCIAAKP